MRKSGSDAVYPKNVWDGVALGRMQKKGRPLSGNAEYFFEIPANKIFSAVTLAGG
jgi:hypothetical protein